MWLLIYHCVCLNNSCKYLSYKPLEAVYGSNPYSIDSNKCKAALHSDYINNKGGYFFTYPIGHVRSFKGSLKNGVATLNYSDYYEGFKYSALSFKLSEKINNLNYPKFCNKSLH